MGGFGALGRLANLHQRWDMFYRTGRFEGGWHVFVGMLPDGRRISLLEDGGAFEAETHPKPSRTFSLYPNARWRAYLTYLRSPGTQAARDRLAVVVGRDWNRQHPELAIDRLEILFVQDRADSEPGRERQTMRWFEGSVFRSPDP